jgi:ATP-dependent RNA helicase SUPV3L1/SUV3
VDALERLDALLRSAPRQGGGALLSEQALEELGWSFDEAEQVMRGLGFAPASRRTPGKATAWRLSRSVRASETSPAKTEAQSPFAALAALKRPPQRRRRPRKRARA